MDLSVERFENGLDLQIVLQHGVGLGVLEPQFVIDLYEILEQKRYNAFFLPLRKHSDQEQFHCV